MEQSAGGPRARYRQQVRAEIQARAWEQIREAGASALSLKSIAKQMGMTAPALYRYFASRDDLLTELILAAYGDLAEVAESAITPDATAEDQLRQIALALRHWAVSNPQRYLLLYGTPVPGYSAPPAARALAQRIFAPVVAGFTAAATARRGVRRDRRAVMAWQRSILFWTRLHGVLSLELAGHFVGMDVDTESLYAQEVRSATEPGA